MAWPRSLLDEYRRLNELENHQERGHAFEGLVARLLRESNFKVRRDVGAALPRQTDLFASDGRNDYLIEAKWTGGPVDVSDIDSLRALKGALTRFPCDQ